MAGSASLRGCVIVFFRVAKIRLFFNMDKNKHAWGDLLLRFSFFEAVEKSVRYIIRAMNLMRIRDFDEQSIDVAFCPHRLALQIHFDNSAVPQKGTHHNCPPAGRRGGLVRFGWGLLMYGKKLRSVLLFAFCCWKNLVDLEKYGIFAFCVEIKIKCLFCVSVC